MISIRNNKCTEKDCKLVPIYGYLNKKELYCYLHKKYDMIDVKHKKCEKCNLRALYGKPGNSLIFCTNHKEEGMMKYSNSKCKACRKTALYGIKDKAIYCETHKTNDTVNIIEKKCFVF